MPRHSLDLSECLEKLPDIYWSTVLNLTQYFVNAKYSIPGVYVVKLYTLKLELSFVPVSVAYATYYYARAASP